ncbi:MAG: type II toxin-antitoxin system RelE/ParE family toxin [Candidatus Marinimicrobia bacterium]|nr:type II toxin-antitoxin system RelE/ParE family toxin [Candidatus Neomarinimicrobiota bacterium]
MKIIWSPLPIERVTEIVKYIAENNPGAADNWIHSVFNSVEKLSNFPESGGIVPELNKEKIRELIHGNYRIIYQIGSLAIEILTVRHGKQILTEDKLAE